MDGCGVVLRIRRVDYACLFPGSDSYRHEISQPSVTAERFHANMHIYMTECLYSGEGCFSRQEAVILPKSLENNCHSAVRSSRCCVGYSDIHLCHVP